MLIEAINALYKKYRLSKYRSLFSRFKERSGSLSATEAFCVDIINLLDKPTMKQFSDFIGVSQSNATYKVNSLIQKGYITKEVGVDDRREFRLTTTDKFHGYFDSDEDGVSEALSILQDKYSDDQLRLFNEMLDVLNEHSEKW